MIAFTIPEMDIRRIVGIGHPWKVELPSVSNRRPWVGLIVIGLNRRGNKEAVWLGVDSSYFQVQAASRNIQVGLLHSKHSIAGRYVFTEICEVSSVGSQPTAVPRVA